MRMPILAFLAGVVFLTACNSKTKPGESNFRKAIDEYLMEHGRTCAVIVRQLPVDVPLSEQKDRLGIGPKLATLEQAGLVRGSKATVVVHGMLEPLQGPTPPQPVEHYELTPEGMKYFQMIPGPLGQTGAFCYGQKSVDSIVKWTEPVTTGAFSQTEVTYTYKIVDLAG